MQRLELCDLPKESLFIQVNSTSGKQTGVMIINKCNIHDG